LRPSGIVVVCESRLVYNRQEFYAIKQAG
jgi:hypothetical protein